MKRLILLALVMATFSAHAYDFMVGGLCYNKNSNGTSVTVTYQNSTNPRYSSLSGAVTIPASVTYSGKTYKVTAIDAKAFVRCTGIKSVTVPSSITSMGEYAFMDCYNITTVNWNATSCQEGDAGILFNRFDGCSSLQSFVFGSGVKKIPAGLCYNLDTPNLTSVTIPNTVTEIGNQAFYNCEGLTTVTIPASVTSFGNYAFSGCTGLTTVNWNATSCGDNGAYPSERFEGCTSLNTFNFGSSVKRIPSGLCMGITSLTSVTLPSSLTEIGQQAFSHCTGLTKVTIPASVTICDSYAFENCTALTTVNWNATSCTDNSYASRFEGCTKLKSVVFGSGVKRVPSGLFRDLTTLTSVTLPSSLTQIGSYAFSNSGLTSVTIPASLTLIAEGAFNECASLATVNWNATSCGDDGDSDISGYFQSCSKLKTFTFGSSVKRIPSELCYLVKSLTTVTIPNSVTEIGQYAFGRCSGLTTVTMGTGVKTIGKDAFEECSALNRVNTSDMAAWCGIAFNNNLSNPLNYAKNLYLSGTKVTNLTIPGTVTGIKAYTFYNCTPMTKVTVPSSVTSVAGTAFTGCTGLATVVWNAASCSDFTTSTAPFKGLSAIKTFTFGSTVTKIPAYLCYNLKGITAITIPAGITSVGALAFSGCTALATVTWNATSCGDFTSSSAPFKGLSSVKTFTFGSGVTKIPAYVCYSLSGLTTTTVPSSMTSIGTSAFAGCSALATVNWNAASCGDFTSSTLPFKSLTSIKTFTFGSTVTKIPAYLCNGLTGITAVTIPTSVTSIGASAFAGCTGLTKVNTTDLAAWCKITFAANTANPLYCGKNLYLSDTKVTSLTIPSTVTTVKDYAFNNCTSVTQLTVPKAVTSVSTTAFTGCTGITAVTWNVPSHADFTSSAQPFKGLSNIKSFNFAGSVTKVPAYICYNLTGITTLTIPSSVTSIGTSAFAGCSALATVNWNAASCGDFTSTTLPFKSLTGIKTFAFGTTVKKIPAYLCNGLTGITAVTIPTSVTSIGASAFAGCTGLTKVNTTDLAAWCKITFAGNTANPLYCGKNLYLSDSKVTELTIPSTITTVKDYTFNNCTSITQLTVPKAVTSVSTTAFTGCTGLTAITWNVPSHADFTSSAQPFKGLTNIKSFNFAGSVTKIPAYICYNLTGITTVTIPASVTSVGTSAFTGCTGLATVNWNATSCGDFTSTNMPFKGLTGIKTFTFGSGVTKIPDYLCNGLTGLTAVTIPAAVKTVGAGAFKDCTGLTRVDISDLTAWFGIAFGNTHSNPLYNAKHLYLNDSKVTSVTIPTKTVKRFVLYNCTDLTNVIVPSSVTSIGASAFNGCTGLTRVDIEDLAAWCGIDFESITSNPLSNAKNLYLDDELVTNLTIPETVGNVKQYTFYNCEPLTSVAFHDNMTAIGEQAFKGCTGLMQATARIGEPQSLTYGADVFSGIPAESRLYVPAGKSDDYRQDQYGDTANPWLAFANVVEWTDGDVNFDGAINTGDVSAIYRFILTSEGNAALCDLNGDGEVNTGDISALYQIILNNTK